MLKSEKKDLLCTSPWIEKGYCDMTNYLHLATLKQMKARQWFFYDGGVLDFLFYIESGLAKVVARTQNGTEKLLYIIDEKNIIGEIGYFQPTHNKCAFQAITNCNIYLFHRNTMDQLLSKDMALSMQMNHSLSRKAKALANHIANSTFRSANYLLMKTLYVLVHEHGTLQDNQATIDLALSHQHLADMAGIHRVTVSNILKKMQQEGILIKQKDHIVILNFSYIANFL